MAWVIVYTGLVFVKLQAWFDLLIVVLYNEQLLKTYLLNNNEIKKYTICQILWFICSNEAWCMVVSV